MFSQNACRQLHFFFVHGSAEKLRPADRADPKRFTVSQPVSKLMVLRGPFRERVDEEARIDMDHEPWSSAFRDDARRSLLARRLHDRAFAGVRARRRCRASSAARASGDLGRFCLAVVRIVRRKAADFETPQRRAISSRSRTVSTSREYVFLIEVMAIISIVWPYFVRGQGDGRHLTSRRPCRSPRSYRRQPSRIASTAARTAARGWEVSTDELISPRSPGLDAELIESQVEG